MNAGRVNPDDFIAAYDDPALSGWTAGRKLQEAIRHSPDGMWPGWRIRIPGARITGRVHLFTGEIIDLPDWVNDIDDEDWPWFERQWQEMDEFDYRMKLAGITGSIA
jgi:hypothetical protein